MQTVMPSRVIDCARSQGAEGHNDKQSGSPALDIRFKEGDLDNQRSEQNNPKRLREVAAVEMAVAYLNGTQNPQREDMSAVDHDPIWLGLTLPDKPDTRQATETGVFGLGAKKRS